VEKQRGGRPTAAPPPALSISRFGDDSYLMPRHAWVEGTRAIRIVDTGQPLSFWPGLG